MDEINPQNSKIGTIWQKFDKTVNIDYKGKKRVYEVYCNYESDANGEFNVLAEYETSNEKLESVKIEKGKYLVFHKTYEKDNDNSRIEAIIETWGKIWEYFSNESSQYKRAYKTDFEYYKNSNEIEFYISI